MFDLQKCWSLTAGTLPSNNAKQTEVASDTRTLDDSTLAASLSTKKNEKKYIYMVNRVYRIIIIFIFYHILRTRFHSLSEKRVEKFNEIINLIDNFL